MIDQWTFKQLVKGFTRTLVCEMDWYARINLGPNVHPHQPAIFNHHVDNQGRIHEQRRTDGLTDGRTDGRTDRAPYRNALAGLDGSGHSRKKIGSANLECGVFDLTFSMSKKKTPDYAWQNSNRNAIVLSGFARDAENVTERERVTK